MPLTTVTVGQTVQLVSGGPVMVVSSFSTPQVGGTTFAKTSWFDTEAHLCSGTFQLAVLQVATASEPKQPEPEPHA
jgi:uncharacterized protein YodC (DUF2158 family)